MVKAKKDPISVLYTLYSTMWYFSTLDIGICYLAYPGSLFEKDVCQYIPCCVCG